MPQKQRKRSVYFYKTGGQPECNAGADFAFTKACQELCAVTGWISNASFSF
jgi:hypothetical protein